MGYSGVDLVEVPHRGPALIFAAIGVHSHNNFAEIGSLIVCGHPGAAAFLLKMCLHLPIENSWIPPLLFVVSIQVLLWAK